MTRGTEKYYRCTRLPAYQIQLLFAGAKHDITSSSLKTIRIQQKSLELIPNRERSHPSLKTEKEIESFNRDIKGCENVIKQQDQKEKELKSIINNKDADFADIRNKLQTNPGYHTLEYIEDKFEKYLNSSATT